MLTVKSMLSHSFCLLKLSVHVLHVIYEGVVTVWGGNIVGHILSQALVLYSDNLYEKLVTYRIGRQ